MLQSPLDRFRDPIRLPINLRPVRGLRSEAGSSAPSPNSAGARGLCRKGSFSASPTSFITAGNSSSGGFSFTFRFRCACGYFVRHRFNSLSGFPVVFHDAQNLQRADDSVAGRGEIAKNHVAALLSAEVQVSLHHFLDDVTVADFRANHFAAKRSQRFVQARSCS